MRKEPGKFMIGICIILFSATLSIEEIITLVLNGVAKEWPFIGVAGVQGIYSFMVFVEMIAALFMGYIVSKISKRKIIVYFNIVATLGGIFAFCFSYNIYMLYIASAIIGFTCSVLSTVSKSMVVELFDEKQVASMYGLQLISTSLVTSLIFIVGGKLASIGWRNVYLLFLVLLLPALSAIFMLPETKVETSAEKYKLNINKSTVKYMLIGFFFALAHMTYSNNIGFLIYELGLSDAFAGYITAALKIASLGVGLTLAYTVKMLKKYTLPFAVILVSLGFVILYFSQGFIISLLGAVMIGIGSGIFSPEIYMRIARETAPCDLTSSMAFINSAICMGMFLNPYIITKISDCIDNDLHFRFLFAGLITAVIGILILVEAKRNKENI